MDQSTEIMESASGLYAEIKRRGLHLRNENGRDNQLLRELCERVGCPDDQLASYLAGGGLTAAELLRALLDVAQPFARMFEEIWRQLSVLVNPRAREEVRVRFGLEEENPRDLDLDQFRELALQLQTQLVDTTQWEFESLSALFEIPRILGAKYRSDAQPKRPYSPDEEPAMVWIDPPRDEFERFVSAVHKAFQGVADAYYEHRLSRERLAELSTPDSEGEGLRTSAILLTDLLPMWNVVFRDMGRFDPSRRRAALEYFHNEIEPRLETSRQSHEVRVEVALDILDLPFWRDRWQTYEMWASLKVLEIIADFDPYLVVSDGRIVLDSTQAGIAARLRCRGFPSACAIVQLQTPYHAGKRQAIKPDLSLCFDDSMTKESRAVVLEYKQRAALDRSHAEEVGESYLRGSPRCSRVLMLNYDETGITPDLPPSVELLEGVQPMNPAAIGRLRASLRQALDDAGLAPEGRDMVVLLDVSSSMGSAYASRPVSEALVELTRIPGIRILRFNDGLVAGGDLAKEQLESLSTGGGTDLKRALTQIEALYGARPTALLLVTDGGYESPGKALSQIDDVLECSPDRLADGIEWLWIRRESQRSH